MDLLRLVTGSVLGAGLETEIGTDGIGFSLGDTRYSRNRRVSRPRGNARLRFTNSSSSSSLTPRYYSTPSISIGGRTTLGGLGMSVGSSMLGGLGMSVGSSMLGGLGMSVGRTTIDGLGMSVGSSMLGGLGMSVGRTTIDGLGMSVGSSMLGGYGAYGGYGTYGGYGMYGAYGRYGTYGGYGTYGDYGAYSGYGANRGYGAYGGPNGTANTSGNAKTQSNSAKTTNTTPPTDSDYEFLGIGKNADKETVRKAYKVLARKYHPDKSVDDKEAAGKRFQDLQSVYSRIMGTFEVD